MVRRLGVLLGRMALGRRRLDAGGRHRDAREHRAGDIERDHEGQTKRRVDHRGDGVADDIATRLHELQHARQLAEHLGRGDEAV